jgi:hypothetical protein
MSVGGIAFSWHFASKGRSLIQSLRYESPCNRLRGPGTRPSLETREQRAHNQTLLRAG